MATPARIVEHKLPTVALVGRVNVGKSTLFNRLLEARLALVSPIPGTTRTRNIGVARWRGAQFRLIDTGGLTFSEDVPFEKDIIKQTELALKAADLIIFVTDIQTGLLPQERQLARQLRQSAKSKPILLIANKTDSGGLFPAVHDRQWRTLGLGVPFPVSAVTGSNVGNLLDTIYEALEREGKPPQQIPELAPIKVAILGRPNVGKSSLFNKLVGEERVIVSPLPHTTREPHDTLVEVSYDDSVAHLLFIDTAGIRRKAKVAGELERLGIGKSLEMIKRADLVLLVLDAGEAITDQDQQLAGLLREHGKSVVMVVNKWDLAEEESDAFRAKTKDRLYGALPHLDFAPIVFVSAKTGYRVHQIFPLLKQAWDARHTELEDETLRAFLAQVTRRHLPTRGRGVRHPKLLGLTQLRSNPPMFEIKIKAKTSLHTSYVHYLANRLREEFNFFATPIIIKLSKMKR